MTMSANVRALDVRALEPVRALRAGLQRPERSEAEAAVRTLIRWAGDDPEREGLAETPARVTRALEEFFAGYAEDPAAILQKSFAEIEAQWTHDGRERSRASVQSTLSKQMPASAAAAVLEALQISGDTPLAHFSRDDRRRLVHALVEWPLPVTGTRGYNFAEATAGGVALTEINPATMESRVVKGLYLVGEMLDVDGRIGGFNFQWAWSSARVAAAALGA